MSERERLFPKEIGITAKEGEYGLSAEEMQEAQTLLRETSVWPREITGVEKFSGTSDVEQWRRMQEEDRVAHEAFSRLSKEEQTAKVARLKELFGKFQIPKENEWLAKRIRAFQEKLKYLEGRIAA